MRSEKKVGMLRLGPCLCRRLSTGFLSGTNRGLQGGKACGNSLAALLLHTWWSSQFLWGPLAWDTRFSP